MSITTLDIAERLGMPANHVQSWAAAWHGWVGQGHHRRLELIDLHVARAWQELGGVIGLGRYYGQASPIQRRAESAIRSDPRRWLLVAGSIAQTYHHAETAALGWLGSGQPAGKIIDLWSVPG